MATGGDWTGNSPWSSGMASPSRPRTWRVVGVARSGRSLQCSAWARRTAEGSDTRMPEECQTVQVTAGHARSKTVVIALVALGVLFGVALRVFILTHALGVLDSDEATTGLIARRLVDHRELPVFYWA